MTYTRESLQIRLDEAYANLDQANPATDDMDTLLHTVIDLEHKLDRYEDELVKQAVRRIVNK